LFYQSELIGGQLESMAQEADVPGLRMSDASLPAADGIPIHARFWLPELDRRLAEPVNQVILRPSPPRPFPA
jgi:hypothetical protein